MGPSSSRPALFPLTASDYSPQLAVDPGADGDRCRFQCLHAESEMVVILDVDFHIAFEGHTHWVRARPVDTHGVKSLGNGGAVFADLPFLDGVPKGVKKPKQDRFGFIVGDREKSIFCAAIERQPQKAYSPQQATGNLRLFALRDRPSSYEVFSRNPAASCRE